MNNTYDPKSQQKQPQQQQSSPSAHQQQKSGQRAIKGSIANPQRPQGTGSK
jgi:hypothetical protein